MFSICSLFRDSQKAGHHEINQVDRFFAQLEPLKPDRYFLVEGDSVDDTYSVLADYRNKLSGRVELFKCNVGGRVASVVEDVRFRALSTVGNVVLKPAVDYPSDVILWVESDFIVPPESFERLLEFQQSSMWENSLGVCAVPMLGKEFYDTWAFEGINGEKYWNHDLNKFTNSATRYMKMRAFGSCAILNARNIKKINGSFGVNGCFPFLCKMGLDAGLDLWCDTKAIIHHPNKLNYNGRYIG